MRRVSSASRTSGSPFFRLLRYASLAAIAVTLGIPGAAFADESAVEPVGKPASPPADAGKPASQFAKAEFDSSLLMGGGTREVDLSRFETGNVPDPGIYNFDVFLNTLRLTRANVRFDTIDGDIHYCVDPKMVERFDVNAARLDEGSRLALAQAADGQCVGIARIVPGASATFDMNQLRLDVSIPQAMLVNRPRGYVDPALWDDGVTAATLAYQANYYHTGAVKNGDSGYAGLTAGFNHDGWRVRHIGSLTVPGQGKVRYQNVATYVQKDIRPLKARLTLGDSFTDGAIRDTIGIRGVQLTSDDQMLPQSMRGYAPMIRGTARTNARVTVTQNGNTLYETTVAPGPFEIQDLYPSGYGADLVVTVTEADGTVSGFTVPYGAAPQLVRKGRVRFSAAAGQLRDGTTDANPPVIQVLAQYGASDLFTLYGGVTYTEHNSSAVVGGAVATPLGALSADVTGSVTDVPGKGSTTGYRVRGAYSTFISPTQTNIAVAAYMQSSSGFWDLRDAVAMRELANEGILPDAFLRERRRFQASVNQSLGRLGNVYLTGSVIDYWNRDRSRISAQAGYSNTFRLRDFDIGFNLDLSRMRDIETGRDNDRLLATISIPLGRGARAPIVSGSYAHDEQSGSRGQVRIHGIAGDDAQLAYGASFDTGAGNQRAGANLQYRARPATLSGSASTGDGGTQYSLGVSGGIVAHPGGITLANQMGDTIGIVEAEGAEGARVTNTTGVEVDGRGYAIVPYLSPYQLDKVTLDTQGLPYDVQFRSTSQDVVPTDSAVVMLHYETDLGRSAVFVLHEPDGSLAPFGATVVDEAGVEKGIVGQNGRAFVSGVPESGALVVVSDNNAQTACRFDYAIPPADGGRYAVLDATCAPDPSFAVDHSGSGKITQLEPKASGGMQ